MQNLLEIILKDEPKYRLKQIKEALFNTDFKKWEDISNLPKELKEKLDKEIPWISAELQDLKISGIDGTQKALLRLSDGQMIETVMMDNSTGSSTVCVSTQAGCPIGCVFCQTGKMGFRRNLSKEEIVDQYRFWMYRGGKISNIVFMGMGEPLLNYQNVRDAIRDILDFTKIGQNHIVVSTVGIIDVLNKILDDELWSNVRIAISLHSANNETRKKIVPIHNDRFFGEIITWSNKYQEKLASKNRGLYFEYVMLGGVNDSDDDAKKLIQFLQKTGQAKVNLISYNQTYNNIVETQYFASLRVLDFQNKIKQAGFMCTIRKSYGADIAGACGQLYSITCPKRFAYRCGRAGGSSQRRGGLPKEGEIRNS